MPALYTERLLLREFTANDADFVHELMNSAGWLRYIGDRNIRTPADARHYLETGPIANYARLGFGLMQVLRRDTFERVGMCGLLRRDSLPEVELGFAFTAAHEGRGFATEAARAVMADARERLRLPRLAAVVQPDNAASLRVLTKLGFQFVRPVQLSADTPALLLLGHEFAAPDGTAPASLPARGPA